jgi:anti-anti-sigma regulatory factor
MLRIEEKKTGNKSTTLKLDGKIEALYVNELRVICDKLMKKGRLTLDFKGVSFIDEESVDMFAKLADKKLKIINCSPFIALLLIGMNAKQESKS